MTREETGPKASFTLDGHTIEFKNGPSAPDPWTAEYRRELGIPCFSTNDCRQFIRIDGEEIRTIRHSGEGVDMLRSLSDGTVKTFDEFLFFYQKFFSGNYPPFSESVRYCNEDKEEIEKYNNLSTAEKKEWLAEHRRALDLKKNESRIKNKNVYH